MTFTTPPVLIVQRFAGRLRFPALFLLTAALFVADLLVPDAIPLIDEILLGLATVLLGSWKRRRRGRDDEEGGGRERGNGRPRVVDSRKSSAGTKRQRKNDHDSG